MTLSCEHITRKLLTAGAGFFQVTGYNRAFGSSHLESNLHQKISLLKCFRNFFQLEHHNGIFSENTVCSDVLSNGLFFFQCEINHSCYSNIIGTCNSIHS